MSYIRIYPTKNNTIFQYFNSYTGNSTTYSQVPISWSQQVNTGANPIMELQDGKGQSKLLFSFDIPSNIKSKLTGYTYSCNLQLFDAGTLFEPAILLKQLKLSYFVDDFVEGDGYSYLQPSALSQVSNWINRDAVNLWANETFTQISTYQLNNINQDLTFDVTNAISSLISINNYSPKFCLEILSHQSDSTNIFTKFIYSQYTNTVFKPYLEIIINDVIDDSVYNFMAGVSNNIYLLNKNDINFIGTVLCKVTDNYGNSVSSTVVNPEAGVYYTQITPTVPSTFIDQYYTIIWNINGVDMYKEFIKVINPNEVFDKKTNELKSLFFYPSTPYSHSIVRQNDIMPFEVISEIRGIGSVVNNDYQFKVISMDGFEMIPWTDVSVYREKMFFYVNTSYFFPELEYEVIVRNNKTNYTIASFSTYRFKLVQDAQSKFRELSASPYFSRQTAFTK